MFRVCAVVLVACCSACVPHLAAPGAFPGTETRRELSFGASGAATALVADPTSGGFAWEYSDVAARLPLRDGQNTWIAHPEAYPTVRAVAHVRFTPSLSSRERLTWFRTADVRGGLRFLVGGERLRLAFELGGMPLYLAYLGVNGVIGYGAAGMVVPLGPVDLFIRGEVGAGASFVSLSYFYYFEAQTALDAHAVGGATFRVGGVRLSLFAGVLHHRHTYQTDPDVLEGQAERRVIEGLWGGVRIGYAFPLEKS